VGGQSIINTSSSSSSSSGSSGNNDKYKLFKQTQRLFPNARIVQTYACTEAGSSITFEELQLGVVDDEDGDNKKYNNNNNNNNNNRHSNDDTFTVVGDDDEYPGTSAGFPPPHIQVEIFHPEVAAATVATTDRSTSSSSSSSNASPPSLLLQPLPHGETGIIGTRGPHVMSGYWNRSGYDSISSNSCKNNNNNDDDDSIGGGWMLTNDLGYIHPQNGKLYFRGRADDVIRTGGESVLASDVERVILDYFAAAAARDNDNHAMVECAVFPLPDEKFGEAVCAAIAVAAIEASMPSPASTASVVGRGVGATAATSVKSNAGSNKNRYNDLEAAVATVVEEDADLRDNIRRFFAKRQIAGYKRPRRVFRIRTASLPRNSSGKVWRHAIIRLCAAATAAEEKSTMLRSKKETRSRL
jgi:acyl-CoA synthetase (AMP-forming)/AMP-acid ligase II